MSQTSNLPILFDNLIYELDGILQHADLEQLSHMPTEADKPTSQPSYRDVNEGSDYNGLPATFGALAANSCISLNTLSQQS